MIPNNQKTSLLVPSQLPEFIRDNPDYANFSLFLKAYYEWLELANTSNSQIATANSSGQGVTYAIKSTLNNKDVDNTIDDFQDYFVNDFLQNFPKESLINKEEAVKIAKELDAIGAYNTSDKLLDNFVKIAQSSDGKVDIWWVDSTNPVRRIKGRVKPENVGKVTTEVFGLFQVVKS